MRRQATRRGRAAFWVAMLATATGVLFARSATGYTHEGPGAQGAVARAIELLESDSTQDEHLAAKDIVGLALLKTRHLSDTYGYQERRTVHPGSDCHIANLAQRRWKDAGIGLIGLSMPARCGSLRYADTLFCVVALK